MHVLWKRHPENVTNTKQNPILSRHQKKDRWETWETNKDKTSAIMKPEMHKKELQQKKLERVSRKFRVCVGGGIEPV